MSLTGFEKGLGVGRAIDVLFTPHLVVTILKNMK